MRRNILWTLAIMTWIAGLVMLTDPVMADQGLEVDGVKVPLGTVLIVFSVGLAWGDLRNKVNNNSKRIEQHMSDFNEHMREYHREHPNG